jgi:hypothetical protein
VRCSATQIESFRLFCQPDNEWMTEAELLATIRGSFTPNHRVNLGSAFGRVLEDPDRYLVPGGFRCTVGNFNHEETFEFGRDVVEPCLAVIDRRGVFEAKAVKSYGPVDVASKADHILGAHLSEFKTTLSSFDSDKYAESCQWRLMVDAFGARKVTYHVFCLSESEANGVISLRSIESMNLYPYPELHHDCAALVREFTSYVTARGLDGVLKARQAAA